METIKNWWNGVKTWFHNSTTIAWARLQVLIGFFLSVAAGIDWTTITSNFNNAKQALWMGIGLTVNGVVTELMRRRRLDA